MPLDPLTIISALVAVFVFWKLKSVLGERTGLEKPPANPFADPQASSRPPSQAPQSRESAVRTQAGGAARAGDPARWSPYAAPGSPTAAGLDAIAAAELGFAPGPFLEGAKIAYEAVITAFAAAERGTLQSLLAPDVYQSFADAIAARESRQEKMTTTFVSLDDAKLESAALESRTARLGVRFTSKQISATHDPNGKLTDGDPEKVVEMDDIWTFAREVDSRDPNWKLVATQSGR